MHAIIKTALLAGAVAMTAVAPASAEFPDKPVTIVVPYPAGGTTDVLARVVGEQLTKKLGQPFVIENKPGASGALAMSLVARADPDGYTLVCGNINTHGINPALRDDLPYDPIADFTPISVLANTPNVLLANTDTDYESVEDVLAAAKSAPGSISFGSTAIGGSPHMSGELMKALGGVDMVHIPYQGGGPMLAAVIGGEVPVAFDNMPSASEHIRAGNVRALAVTTTTRWPEHPDIPTFKEAGMPEYDVTAWFGLLAPAGTPAEAVAVLESAIGEIMQQDDVKARLAKLGAEPVGSTSDEFKSRIDSEVERWSTIAEEAGISLQ